MDPLVRLAAILGALPFVRELGLSPVFAEPGRVIVEAPFETRFSTPPGLFPASIVGAVGDVAAISAAGSALDDGWAVATLDYTIKMLAPAKGQRLRAVGVALGGGGRLSTARADISVIDGEEERPVAVLLATGRNFQLSGRRG